MAANKASSPLGLGGGPGLPPPSPAGSPQGPSGYTWALCCHRASSPLPAQGLRGAVGTLSPAQLLRVPGGQGGPPCLKDAWGRVPGGSGLRAQGDTPPRLALASSVSLQGVFRLRATRGPRQAAIREWPLTATRLPTLQPQNETLKLGRGTTASVLCVSLAEGSGMSAWPLGARRGPSQWR